MENDEIKKLSEMENTLKGMIKEKSPPTNPTPTTTTSERIRNVTKGKISKVMKVYSKKSRKITVNTKTSRQKQTVFEMFKDRKKIIVGLTKEETLADFLNKSLSELFNLTEKERILEWIKFKERCKCLRQDEMIGIVSDRLSAGTVLRDIPGGHWGDRPLKKKQHVYHRCYEMDDAQNFRNKMDKVIYGVDEAGNQITKIAEEHKKNKEVIEVMNGNGQKNEN